MARAEIEREIKITLILSENEAVFIKNLCQNYLGGSANENERIRKMREGIFNVIKESLEDT